MRFPRHSAGRFIGALTMQQASVAVGTGVMVFFHPEDGYPRENPKQRPERAQVSAPKPDHVTVGDKNGGKNGRDHCAEMEERRRGSERQLAENRVAYIGSGLQQRYFSGKGF